MGAGAIIADLHKKAKNKNTIIKFISGDSIKFISEPKMQAFTVHSNRTYQIVFTQLHIWLYQASYSELNMNS